MNRTSQLQNPSLKDRAFRASSITMLGYALSQAIRLGSNLILTRLLVPEMFGVMSVVTVIIIGLNLFSDIGLLQNVVNSKRGEERLFLNTVWASQIIRGVFLFVLMLLISFLFSQANILSILPTGSAYAYPALPNIIALLSLTILISALNSTKMLTANRKLMMGHLTLIEIISQIISVVFIITWASIRPEIWALVYGGIVASSIKMILSHVLIPGRNNRLEWDWKAFHEIFHFGKWIFATSIFGFLLGQGDQLILGGLISAEKLGIYSIALLLAIALRQLLSKVFATVLYPALTEVARERKNELSDTYYKIRRYVDGVTFFTAGFFFFTGHILITFLYDDRYHAAGWMMEVLVLSLITVGPGMLADQCFLALGRARELTYMIIMQVILLFSLLPLLFYLYGMEGAVWATVITPLIKIFVSFGYMKQFKILKISKEVKMLPIIFVGGLLGFIIDYYI